MEEAGDSWGRLEEGGEDRWRFGRTDPLMAFGLFDIWQVNLEVWSRLHHDWKQCRC